MKDDLEEIHARPLSTVLAAPPAPYGDQCRYTEHHDWRHNVHAAIVGDPANSGDPITAVHRVVSVCDRCGVVATKTYIDENDRLQEQDENDYQDQRVEIERLRSLIVRAMRGETAPRL